MAAVAHPNIPAGLPLAYNSFNFHGESSASQYMMKEKLHLLAPGQITVPKGERGYWGVLNQQGMALLSTTKTSLHTAKGKLMGRLQIARTGGKTHSDGSVALCTWQNLTFQGREVETADPRLLTTSAVVLYELDKDGKGWIRTVSGSIYIVLGE